ncbi:hypothetical protein [Bacillus paramycoides]|uniref:hypothetical protein n=1 Tax=Bacillus paramycoides TaxID=2026194 RepID=UPI002E1ACDA5|nr:hypothetical protein [Bacillus paramycoides]
MSLTPEEIMELTLEEIKELTDKEISGLYRYCSSEAESIVNAIITDSEHLDDYDELKKAYDEFEKEYEEIEKKYFSKPFYNKIGYIKKRFTAKLLAKALYIFDYKFTKSPTEVLGLYVVRHKLMELHVVPNKMIYDWELDVTIEDYYQNIPLTIDIHGKEIHATEFQKARDARKRANLAQKGIRYLVFEGTDLVHNMSAVENKIKEVLTEEYEKVNSIYLFKKRYKNA